MDCSKSWGTMVCGLQNDNNIQLLSCAQVDLWLCETYVDLFVTNPHDFLSISILSSPNTEIMLYAMIFIHLDVALVHHTNSGRAHVENHMLSTLKTSLCDWVVILFLNCLLYGLFML